jgi:uncharacterized protein (DUF983 family)
MTDRLLEYYKHINNLVAYQHKAFKDSTKFFTTFGVALISVELTLYKFYLNELSLFEAKVALTVLPIIILSIFIIGILTLEREKNLFNAIRPLSWELAEHLLKDDYEKFKPSDEYYKPEYGFGRVHDFLKLFYVVLIIIVGLFVWLIWR